MFGSVKGQGSRAEEVWERSLETLSNWMANSETDPNIAHRILSALCAWRMDSNVNEQSFHYQPLMQVQQGIGW
jgi:hypothetical protein